MADSIGGVIDRLRAASVLDAPAELMTRAGGGAPHRIAQRAQQLLGHPLHPMLTDLPIGFWTSAWFLDLSPDRAATSLAARRLLGVGVLCAVPAAWSGGGDAVGLDRRQRRVAAVHAALNVAATTAFAYSWVIRRGRTDSRRARRRVSCGSRPGDSGGPARGTPGLSPIRILRVRPGRALSPTGLRFGVSPARVPLARAPAWFVAACTVTPDRQEVP